MEKLTFSIITVIISFIIGMNAICQANYYLAVPCIVVFVITAIVFIKEGNKEAKRS